MICNKNLAYVYAKSIFNVALKNNQVDHIQKILFIISYITTHHKIKNIYSKYSDSLNLYQLFIFLLYDFKIQGYEKNFLKILIKNKRLFLMKEIYIKYKSIKRKYNKIIYVIIKLSSMIDDIQKKKIKSILEKFFIKKMKFKFLIDSNLIGGLVILIDDFVIDLSIQNNLTYLKNFLKT